MQAHKAEYRWNIQQCAPWLNLPHMIHDQNLTHVATPVQMGELQFAPDSPWHATPMARYLGSLTGGRIGTPRKPRTPKGPGAVGGARDPSQVQMSAHAGDPDTPGATDTPGSSAATVSPQAQQHDYYNPAGERNKHI